ncbi:MAG TPA: adenylate/guanylate cyclase domain-containing protein [Xanthobacteraceae bacterium]|nr:adenylate/guanylate cyclase domain-containing protein [Xanthobacteraceae bacterium]
MLRIFISYRRADTLGFAGRISERLRAKYGVSSVCLDVDTIPLATDFRSFIVSEIEACDVVLVLIGERWTAGVSSDAPCRLFDENDYVRLEIESALDRNIPVVPLLVGTARLPTKSQVPPCLERLLYRTGFHIDEGPDFHHHIDRLISRLNKDIKRPLEPAPSVAPLVATAPAEIAAGDTVRRAPPTGDEPHDTTLQDVDSRAPPQPDAGPNLAPIRLTLIQGVAVTAFLLALNSMLATLGSMLFSYVPYWPAYMVSALAIAFFRGWGLLVILLSPIVSSLLMIGGAPAYLYLPSNALQGALILAAFVLGRIDPSLPRIQDIVKYLILAVICASICGALLAWWLRSWTGVGANDSDVLTYTFFWVAENFTPAVFPGIWLHRVIGSLRRPTGWATESRWAGWVGLTLAHAVPGTVTLFLSISACLFLVTSRLREIDIPNPWDKIHELAGNSATFRWLVLATSVSLLISIGVAVRHARHAWQLEQAIRRQMPSKEEAERILSGKITQIKRRTVSLIVFNLNNFGEAARTLRPQTLVAWLNAYFDCLAAAVERFGGQVEYFDPDKTLVIFGSREEENHASSAMQCAIDALDAFRQLSGRLAGKDIVGLVVSMGIHSGAVVAGDIGSRDRRYYTVVGDTVELTSQVAREARGYADGPFAALFSISIIKEAGLLATSPQRVGLIETTRLNEDAAAPLPLFAVADPNLLRQSLILDSARSI